MIQINDCKDDLCVALGPGCGLLEKSFYNNLLGKIFSRRPGSSPPHDRASVHLPIHYRHIFRILCAAAQAGRWRRRIVVSRPTAMLGLDLSVRWGERRNSAASRRRFRRTGAAEPPCILQHRFHASSSVTARPWSFPVRSRVDRRSSSRGGMTVESGSGRTRVPEAGTDTPAWWRKPYAFARSSSSRLLLFWWRGPAKARSRRLGTRIR